jgi:hypothetical protein
VFEKIFSFTSLIPCGFYLSFYISNFGEEITRERAEMLGIFLNCDFYISLSIPEKIMVSF